MYQPIILCIALRYLYSKTINHFSRCVYWISNIFIMLSMIILIIILSVMNGFESKLKKNTLFLTPHAIITSLTRYVHNNDFPDFLSSKMESNDIIYIKPLIISDVVLQSAHNISFGSMFGVNPNHFDPLFKYLICSKSNQLVSNKYYIIIGESLARLLSVKISDQIRLIIPSVNQITPIGCFPRQRLFTVLDIYSTNSDIDGYQVIINQDDAAKLMGYPPTCITGWRIWLSDPYKIKKFDHLKISQKWNWKDWSIYKGDLFQAIKIEKNMMCLLFILIIIVSMFNIVSFLMLFIINKQKEIAILKTYGLKRLHVVIIFIIQSVFSSIFSIMCGSVLGILLSTKLNQILFFLRFFSKTLQIPVEIQYLQILIIGVIICILMILAAFYPAWYIGSKQPAQVLRHD